MILLSDILLCTVYYVCVCNLDTTMVQLYM